MTLILLALFIGVVCYACIKYNEIKSIKQVTSITRGERSERKFIVDLMKAGINPKAIFHDLYFKKPNGEYTQVDLAVATKAGIIVFEIKEYSGWIFGSEHQRYWTQVLAYGKEKNRFYNPIMQNAGHINVIRKKLKDNPGIPIYSVIVFCGNCELKSITCDAPNTCIIHPQSIRKVLAEILMQPDALYGNKHEIMDVFTEAVQNGNNPLIVSSQINYASYCGRNTPPSTYTSTFRFPFSFRPFRRRFW